MRGLPIDKAAPFAFHLAQGIHTVDLVPSHPLPQEAPGLDVSLVRDSHMFLQVKFLFLLVLSVVG